jgi:DNA-3-methyladenine glycosylase I
MLLKNEKIIRSRRKIEGIIKNANAFVKIQQEFGSFDKYIWGFVGDKTIRYAEHVNGFPAKNALSDKISKDLKAYGFTYLGSITVYSHLQAAGLINDHASYCYKY